MARLCALSSLTSRVLRWVALSLIPWSGTAGVALAQPVCPPTSPDPVTQTVDVGQSPAPLRLRLDLISGLPPDAAALRFEVTSTFGTVAGGQNAATIIVTAQLIDPNQNLWRYIGQVDVDAPNQTGVITVRGSTPLCTGVVDYTIDVVAGGPQPAPAIRVLEGAGARVEPGRTVALGVRVENPPQAANVAAYPLRFDVIEGDARFESTGSGSINASTDASGAATVTVRAGTAPGRVAIRVSPGAGASFVASAALAELEIVQVPPRTFSVVAGDGQSGEAGTDGQPLVAQLVGFNGLPVPDVPVEWRTVAGPPVTLTAPTGTTAANGRVQTGLRFAGQPGTSTVEARTANGETARFTVTTLRGRLVLIVAGGNEQSGAVGSEGDAPLVFALTEDGDPVASEPVSFRVVEGDAVLLATSGTTDDGGRASVRFRYGTQPGRIRFEAAARGITATATATAFTPSLRIVSGNNQSGRTGARLPLDLVIEIAQPAPQGLDKGLGGVTVSWSVLAGGGVLASASNTTNAQGRASNQLTLGPSPGENRIRASIAGVGAVEFVATAQQAPTSRLVVVAGDNQSGAVGSDGDEPIVFLLTEDERPVAGEVLSFRVAEGSAVLAATTGTTDANGRVGVRFRYGANPGRVRIEGSARGATATATATAFVPGVRIVSGNNQSGRVGTRLAQDLVLELVQPAPGGLDKGLGGVAVAWTVIGGGGTLATASNTTNAQGRAANQLTLGPNPGENRIRATLPGIGSVEFVATATDPVPAGSVFEIVSGNGQTLPTGAPSAPLVVRLRTAAGAAVAGTTVAFTLTPATNGSLANASAVTAANGQAQTVVTLGAPGETRVIASLPDAGPGGPTLVFTLNGGVVNTLNLDPAERSIAGAIDSACPALLRQSQSGPLAAGAADLLARCSELIANAGTRPDGVRNALRQMLSEESDAQNDASIAAARAQYDNLASRVSALRSGSTGVSVAGLGIATGSGVLPLSFLPSALLMQDGSGATDEVGSDFARWGFFATGTIGRAERDDRGSSPGFDLDTYGLTAGVDYRFSDRFVAGVALGYTDTDTEINAGAGEVSTRGYSLSGYATWYRGESFYVDAVATLGRNSYEISRRIVYTLGNTRVDQTAFGDPDGDQRSLSLSLGRDINRGAFNFSPYLRAAWTRIDFDPYVERMSSPGSAGGGLALAIDGRRLKSFEGVLGAKASYTMSRSWGILIPHASFEFLREFEDDPNLVVSRFVNDPTRTPIIVEGAAPDRDYFNLGLGLSGVFANGRSAFVYLENRAGQRDFSQTTLAAGLRIEF